MAETEKLKLPKISGNMTADVVRDLNALAEAIDEKVGVPGGLATLDAEGKLPTDQLDFDTSDLATKTELEAHVNNADVHVTPAKKAEWDAKETPQGAQQKANQAEQNAKNYADQRVSAHASRTDNPHGVTKGQVGLGNVQNYGIATEAEATAGTASNKYMTPQRTKQAIDALQAVKSVNGKTGAVTLSKGDIGLGNVDNVKQASKAEFDAHVADITTEEGRHGLRFMNNKLEIKVDGDWRYLFERPKIYGVRIDKNNSNPETRVTYIGDALGFTPMRGNNGNFSWGSWKDIFESFEIRPCVLKNKQVQYYLDPNDFTKKIDGSNANLTGADGDVMIEFGKTLWWKWTDEGSTYTIEISDKEFDGAVKHAFEIEEGYNIVPYYPLLLTQILFVIFFKSTDSQTALGRGYVDDNTSYASTGNTNNKGMFYGSESGSQQMKFLGIEDYWGNKFWWIDGLVTDSNYNLLIGKGNFNDNGSGYQSFTSGITSNTYGYIDSVQGGNDKGFIIKSKSGSETTYYADYGYLFSASVARFGGYRSAESFAGFATLQLSYSAESSPLGSTGARLFCASNGKIYIGAYLGTSIDGKLRSVSGTPEPTGSKKIGTFRNEARANN